LRLKIYYVIAKLNTRAEALLNIKIRKRKAETYAKSD
jgi:hypothetical protein